MIFIESLYEPAHEHLVLIAHVLSRSSNVHGYLSSEASCLNLSMCVQAVKALTMLCISAVASEY